MNIAFSTMDYVPLVHLMDWMAHMDFSINFWSLEENLKKTFIAANI